MLNCGPELNLEEWSKLETVARMHRAAAATTAIVTTALAAKASTSLCYWLAVVG